MKSVRPAVWLAAAAILAWAASLASVELYHDDRFLIAENPLLQRGLSAIAPLLTTGYVESVIGGFSPIHEYRPVLLLSYWIQTAVFGLAAFPLKLFNLLLHALASVLLWRVLKSRLRSVQAVHAALIFAVLPIHAEAVVLVTGRSELLSATFLLGAWLVLETRRTALGAGLFAAALLTKESSVMFPVLLSLWDWTFHGVTPWDRSRRRTWAWLLAALTVYLLLRAALLPRFIHGGIPYFPDGSRLTAALTLAHFALERYLWPAATGLGLCPDFSRPLVPDADARALSSWLWLAPWAILLAAGLSGIIRRRPWAFWALAPLAFLLPSSNLIFPLDTLGAQRWLYLPSMGLCVGLARLIARLPERARTAALAAFVLWYGTLCARQAARWTTAEGYYTSAATCNPLSPRPWVGLGAAFMAKGWVADAEAAWRRATALDSAHAAARYNLARLAWERGRTAEAERLAREAIARAPGVADYRVLLALTLEARGARREALAELDFVLARQPGHALADEGARRLRGTMR